MASRQGLSPSAREFKPQPMAPVMTAGAPANPSAASSPTTPNKPHRVMVQMGSDCLTTVAAECNLALCTISDLYAEVAAKTGQNAKAFQLYFESTPLMPSTVKLLDIGIGNFQTVTCIMNGDNQATPAPQVKTSVEATSPTASTGLTPNRNAVNMQVQMTQQLQQLQVQHQVLQQQKTQSAKIQQLQARISHLMNSPLPPTQYQGQMLGVLRYQLAIEVNQMEQIKIAAEYGLPPPPPLPQNGFANGLMQTSGGMSPAGAAPFTPPPVMGMGMSPTPLAPPMVGTSPNSSLGMGGSPLFNPTLSATSSSPATSSPTSSSPSGGCINLTALASKFSTFATSPGGSRGLIEAMKTTPNLGKVVDLIIQDLQDMAGMSTDENGAEVLKKLGEVSSPKQLSALLAKCMKSRAELLEIAESPCGCDILMTFIESSAADTQGLEANLTRMIELISTDVTPFLTTDAKKLVMKLLIKNVSEQGMAAFWASLMEKAVAISCDTKGCVGIKKCIDLAPAKVRAVLVSRIMEHSARLITNEYGNYVVQHIFDAATVAELWSKISEERTFVRYATDKIASHVVEKLIKQGTEETFRSIMKAIMRPAVVSTIIKDQYGNYIVQCAIDRMPSDLVMAMREAISPYLSDSQFGHKIEQKVTRRVKELNASESKQSKAAADILARIEAAAAAVKSEAMEVPPAMLAP
eukprot:TRINITY_DN25231_c0_g1_i1.p1 TRINITY_DN25231_c0_g1~~TRINITY_DN25231_c0_g1_i1.p1  ORF type:complete len:750 (+),score=285.70 TRINITY_DN25231_c0_g1_i1:177-2252(+)